MSGSGKDIFGHDPQSEAESVAKEALKTQNKFGSGVEAGEEATTDTETHGENIDSLK